MGRSITQATTYKSIQRGYAGGGSTAFNVAISTVVPEKCVVHINGVGGMNTNTSSNTEAAMLTAISATSLTVRSVCSGTLSADTAVPFMWQVLETW